jgi:3-deoxy-manno-octulosonate cytidylyltransferase (CMP-KDO synthetase)
MVLAVIPARFASTRFPGKPLVDIAGKPMIQRVWEQVQKATLVDQIIVATDDERIEQAVLAFGGQVMMTRPDHPSGTDRCAEVAAHFPKATVIVNVQGDEPFVHPDMIDLVVEMLAPRHQPQSGIAFNIATLAKQIQDTDMITNPNVVKVLRAASGQALYFSRHAVPFIRDTPPEQWIERQLHYKHIGMYGYKREALLQIAQLPPSPLEQAESLEQLRWLENGYTIGVQVTEHEAIGVDTPEDLAKLKGLL